MISPVVEMARAFHRAVRTLGYLPLRRPKFATGGVVQGPRPDDDSIPVWLTPGCNYRPTIEES